MSGIMTTGSELPPDSSPPSSQTNEGSAVWGLGILWVVVAVAPLSGCVHGFIPGGVCGLDRGCDPETHNLAAPDTYPLGSVVRAHTHTMQTNAEASDFILHRHEFVDETTELTSDGKDHLLEIAARLPGTPFPVLVQRSANNATPELDARRRESIVRVLAELDVPDADVRTFVAPTYGRGLTGREAESNYIRYLSTRRGRGIGGFGAPRGRFGFFGGFGGSVR